MVGDANEVARRAAFLVGSILAAACLVLFALLLWNSTAGQTSTAARTSAYASSGNAAESPNAVTSGMSEAAAEAGKRLQGLGGNVGGSLGSAAGSAATATADVGLAVFHGVGAGLGAAGRGIASTAVFIVRIPVNIFGFFGNLFTNAPVVSAAIRPTDHEDIPVIDPDSPALAAAQTALPATPAHNQGNPQLPPEPIWPVRGAVTTEFGVYHMPYQHTHTGIDISDGSRPGTTPVHPFRHGKVIVVSGSGGLGNHVIVDHGGGVTSVYAHLASIAVQLGQDVNTANVVGMQGTTGVSTGTHLHFEIRVNGQAANPRIFIPGQP